MKADKIYTNTSMDKFQGLTALSWDKGKPSLTKFPYLGP